MLLPCAQLAALSAKEAGSEGDAEDGVEAVLAAAAAAHQLLLALCTDPALGLLSGGAGDGGEWDAAGSGSSGHPGAFSQHSKHCSSYLLQPCLCFSYPARLLS